MHHTTAAGEATPGPDDSRERPATPVADDAGLARGADEADAADGEDAPTGARSSFGDEPTVVAGEGLEAPHASVATAGVAEPAGAATGEGSAAPVVASVAEDVQPKSKKRVKQEQRREKARKAARRAARAESELPLAADAPFAAALPAILGARLAAVLAQVSAVQADDDPEAVHDMRVATRRLRSALLAAEPFFERKPFRRASRRVRALTRALGRVRDADVLLAYLRERYGVVAEDERSGVEGLIDLIESDRAGGRDDLALVLDEWDDDGPYAADFRRFLRKTRPRSGKLRERERTGVVAARALDADLDRFEGRAAFLAEREGGDAEAFHTLRIAGKKLRYTIELFSPVLGEDAADLLTALKTLQGLLGELHDRDVLIDLLAWERARALERQLHSLEFTTFNPGTRRERLDATRAVLAAPDSFAETAVGIYGLLIDAATERDALEEELRATWAGLGGTAFLPRLRALAGALSPRAAEESATPTTATDRDDADDRGAETAEG